MFSFFCFYLHRKKMKKLEATKKELLHTTIRIMELDNKRIAKNIHDDIGSVLSLAKLNLDYIISETENQPIKKQVSEEVLPLIDQAIEDSKYITSDLLSVSIAKMGFEKAILNHCSLMAKTQGVSINCNFSGTKPSFSDLIEQKIYRVLKEVLANIIRHDNAQEININVLSVKETYSIHFKHNGKGISNEAIETLKKEAKGVGLTSIFNRLECLDASINYAVRPTPQIIIQIPLI